MARGHSGDWIIQRDFFCKGYWENEGYDLELKDRRTRGSTAYSLTCGSEVHLAVSPPFLLFFLLAHPGFALAQLLVRKALPCGTAARAVRRCSGRHGFGTRRLDGFAPLGRVLLGIPPPFPRKAVSRSGIRAPAINRKSPRLFSSSSPP